MKRINQRLEYIDEKKNMKRDSSARLIENICIYVYMHVYMYVYMYVCITGFLKVFLVRTSALSTNADDWRSGGVSSEPSDYGTDSASCQSVRSELPGRPTDSRFDRRMVSTGR